MIDFQISTKRRIALVGLMVGALWVSAALAGTDRVAPAPSTQRTARTAAATRKVSPYRPANLTPHAQVYYAAAWGVDKLKVSYTASGTLIRFSYRVENTGLAEPLSDAKATAYMLGQRSRALLQIPVMDKVGKLRQTGATQKGQEYWMVFSNKGNLIRRGDRVNVMIGRFHADGLIVE
jgi:hypothetical protein